MVTSLQAAPNAARERSIGTMLILYYQNLTFPSKGADAAFAAGVAPNGIVQLAQLVIKLYQTVIVGDQLVLFRVGQEAQAADEGGLIIVVEVVVIRQIEVRFIYLVPQVGVLFADAVILLLQGVDLIQYLGVGLFQCLLVSGILSQSGSCPYNFSIWASSSFNSLMSARRVSFSASVRALVLRINAASSKFVKS